MMEISCIIVNYNTAQITIDAVESIIKSESSNLNFEIIIVDNASTLNDYSILKVYVEDLEYINIKLVRSTINTGFGSGNMLGVIHASNCDYYAFINSDVLFTQNNTLSQLRDFMDGRKDIGVCSPQMLNADGEFRSTIDHFATPARQLFKRGFLEKLDSKKYPKRKIRYQEPQQCNYVQGSFMFVDAQSFREVGGFDTNLFLYYEESDLSRRIIKKTGKTTYLYPLLDYIHLQGKSTGKNILIKMEQKISVLYLIQKHHGIFWHRFLLNFYRVKYVFSSLLKPKNLPLLKLLWKGAGLDHSLARKQKIQAK